MPIRSTRAAARAASPCAVWELVSECAHPFDQRPEGAFVHA
jgi:hypothetical protein